MYLFLMFLERADQPERAIRRLRDFNLPEPWVVRARSAMSVLSAEVPIFAGLRGLAVGADEDRLLLMSLLPEAPAAEVERLVQRLQLEMDADDPPMGRLVVLPVIGAPQHRRE